ncbi:hypothetical protein [Poriferisphaera sp. WC338]|uniref:hypothetical protein n=1 Tax=Poriferisphaera sp. WC338 TaxID=3425129 RepID=UPI003D816484
MNGPDYIVDIEGVGKKSDDGARGGGDGDGGMKGRRWIAVKWKCCGAYSRVYKNKAGDAYEGRCPKCVKPLKVKIGSGGTSARFFEAQ